MKGIEQVCSATFFTIAIVLDGRVAQYFPDETICFCREMIEQNSFSLSPISKCLEEKWQQKYIAAYLVNLLFVFKLGVYCKMETH